MKSSVFAASSIAGLRVAVVSTARKRFRCPPSAETRPWVGRMPNTPHRLAGSRTEPAQSVPRAKSARPPATAEAAPLDHPPGIRPTAHTSLTASRSPDNGPSAAPAIDTGRSAQNGPSGSSVMSRPSIARRVHRFLPAPHDHLETQPADRGRVSNAGALRQERRRPRSAASTRTPDPSNGASSPSGIPTLVQPRRLPAPSSARSCRQPGPGERRRAARKLLTLAAARPAGLLVTP